MSLLIGDDYPEGVGPQDRENQEPARSLRRRSAPGGTRRERPRWRGNRPRSMLIQDAPDPAEDDAGDGHDTEDDYDTGPPYPGNGFFLDPGSGPDGYPPDDYYPYDTYPGDRISEDRYPVSGYADFPDSGPGPLSYPDPGYAEPGSGYAALEYPGSEHPNFGYPDVRYPSSGYSGSGYSGHTYAEPGGRNAGASDREGWDAAEDDGFRAPPAPDDYRWGNGGGAPGLEEEPSSVRHVPIQHGPRQHSPVQPAPIQHSPIQHPRVQHAPVQEIGFLPREPRDTSEGGSRRFVTSAQRLGGVLLAAASVIGAVLYVPSILAANSRSFVGVVSSGVASLNFKTSGRVGSVRVHLGQVVRKGDVLATEAGATGTSAVHAVQADRAAITADKANLATLRADGSAAASITVAQQQLTEDRHHRRVDQKKLNATEIVAPGTGTVVAINGQRGETVSPAGLRGPAVHGRQPRFSLLPGGPRASGPATGTALPVIAVRTRGGWQVRLLIPQTDTSAVRAGEHVTISVPAAQISGIKGTVSGLSPTPVINSGGTAYQALVQVLGQTQITPLTGMTANVQLGSLQLRGRATQVTGRPASVPRAGVTSSG